VADLPGEKVQAIVHIRSYTAFNPTVMYDVKLPSGYALRATANQGRVQTMIAKMPRPMGMPPTMGDYRSVWTETGMFKPPLLHFGQPQQIRPYSPPTFEQHQARQAALGVQLQELLDQGPISVVLGQPKLLFSTTNDTGEIYQGFLELVGPPTGP